MYIVCRFYILGCEIELGKKSDGVLLLQMALSVDP